ncbi:MAG: hypothetical protein HOW73_16250 [Polyangiaceae bacterium]|nr:hypothetical protein [Polyangiaceae bacterium]
MDGVSAGRVLYLDREMSSARARLARLTNDGYEVVTCDRWAEAFGLLSAIRFDALVICVGSVTHALCALLQAAKVDQPGCRRIAISASEPEAVLRMCGAQEVLPRPLDYASLRDVLPNGPTSPPDCYAQPAGGRA